MEIGCKIGKLMVWLTLLLGLAYTGLSAVYMFQDGREPPAMAVALQVLFGLFLTVALTGVLNELVGWASKMSTSSSKEITSQPEMQNASSKKDDSQPEEVIVLSLRIGKAQKGAEGDKSLYLFFR